MQYVLRDKVFEPEYKKLKGCIKLIRGLMMKKEMFTKGHISNDKNIICLMGHVYV